SPLLMGTVQRLRIENSLDPAQTQNTMNISLHGMTVTTAALGGHASQQSARQQQTLLEPVQCLTVSIRSTFDPIAGPTSSKLLTVTGPLLELRVTDQQLVDVVSFLSSNVLRMVPPAEDAAMVYQRRAPASPVIVLAPGAMPPPPGGVVVRILFDGATVTFLRAQRSSSAVLTPVHRATLSKLVVNLIPQQDQKQISWESIGIFDIRDATALSKLVVNLIPQQDQKQISWESIGIFDIRDATVATSSCNSSNNKSALLLCGTSAIEILTKKKSGGVVMSTSRRELMASSSDDDDSQASSSTGDSAMTVVPGEVVLSIDIGFSIKRFAVSEQWLSVYDFVVNESVMFALKPLTAGQPPPQAAQLPTPPPPPQQAMEIVLRAEKFMAPFLSSATGEELFVADITNLELRIQKGGGGGGGAGVGGGVFVRLEVVAMRLFHCASQCYIIESSTATSLPLATPSSTGPLTTSTAAGPQSPAVAPSSTLLGKTHNRLLHSSSRSHSHFTQHNLLHHSGSHNNTAAAAHHGDRATIPCSCTIVNVAGKDTQQAPSILFTVAQSFHST
ncbi:Hypothetical protein, putative, partial [Bodo saltans]